MVKTGKTEEMVEMEKMVEEIIQNKEHGILVKTVKSG